MKTDERVIIEGSRIDTGEIIERKAYKSPRTAVKEYLIRLATLSANITREDKSHPGLRLRDSDEFSLAYSFKTAIEDSDGEFKIKFKVVKESDL